MAVAVDSVLAFVVEASVLDSVYIYRESVLVRVRDWLVSIYS